MNEIELRDLFALSVAHALLSRGPQSAAFVAREAYEVAERMLEEREKK